MAFHDMAEYRRAVETFDWALPETFNFGRDVVDATAAEAPDRLALLWTNDDGVEERFTWAEIARESAKLASVLAGAGIERGDRVVVMLPRIPQWQIAMVACLKLGAVTVPCISMLTERDLAYRVEHSGAVGIVTTADNTDKAPAGLNVRIAVGGGPEGWLDWDAAMVDAPAAFEPPGLGLEEPATIYYTSGTTGSPKGVTHAVRAIHAWRWQAKYWTDLGPGDLMWCTADTGWSKAGTSVLYGPWSMGAGVLFHDGAFDPARRLELLEKHRVTVFCAAATELRRLVYEDVSARDLSALRHTVSAGEALNPEVAQRWAEATGRPVHEGYGQTETLMSVHNYPGLPQKPGSMGLPLPGYEIAIMDEDGTRKASDEAGMLAIKLPNPNFMLGYWREPERTREQIVEADGTEWWLTGDAAHMDADGYVLFHGRSDDVISSAGYRIGPSEVENALLEHPAVQECAAVASPDPERGEVVKAFVVLAAGHEASDALVAEIQEHCKRLTAPYKYPRRVEFVDDLPKNVAGKILRKELKAREFAGRP